MPVQVTPHPKWVADLDAVLDPGREAILDTPVIVDASENQLVDGRIQDFLVNFYRSSRLPAMAEVLLDRSPEDGKVFSATTSAWKSATTPCAPMGDALTSRKSASRFPSR